MLTILNRYWVRQRFEELRRKATRDNVKTRYENYVKRIDTARFLLAETQQVPLRVSQARGWLSSLVVLPQNEHWWDDLLSKLQRTRRGRTASLYAQIISAALAFVFTVVSAFVREIDDTDIVLQISAGTLWIWLVSYQSLGVE
jgi:hypothetical protein